MKRYFSINSIFFFSFILQTTIYADAPNNSNLINFSYPKHSCKEKPKHVQKPLSSSQYESTASYNQAIAEYNVKISVYNKKIQKYKKCINHYIANGNNDINSIRKILNSALKEARSK